MKKICLIPLLAFCMVFTSCDKDEETVLLELLPSLLYQPVEEVEYLMRGYTLAGDGDFYEGFYLVYNVMMEGYLFSMTIEFDYRGISQCVYFRNYDRITRYQQGISITYAVAERMQWIYGRYWYTGICDDGQSRYPFEANSHSNLWNYIDRYGVGSWMEESWRMPNLGGEPLYIVFETGATHHQVTVELGNLGWRDY